ncbi:alpha-(1,3)-fucosyltransferase C-like [Epargyreus clarus]|uniref:alpha-(1,3)-fucosyltransferase C-like n=1 Tax=Epargyreus clarus TaxID=520877 RepID=UPI003C2E911F
MYKVREMIFISPLRKNLIKYGVYVALFTMGSIIFSIPHYLTDHSEQFLTKPEMRFSTDLKYILLWKPSRENKFGFYYPKEQEIFGGQSVFIKQKCEFINCYITYNKHFLRADHRNFDAVVFSVRDIANLRPKDVNLTRSPYQKYVFHSLEPAAKYPICNTAFDGFFNWTWTYKLSSDIVHPFFNIYDKKNKVVGPRRDVKWVEKMTHKDRFTKKISKKTKAVALMVYTCTLKTKYQEYIKELHDELHGYNYTLDLYGPCGNIKCPKNRIFNCYKIIEEQYFFQLVLEDYITEDYVTDRIVKAMTHLAIPIVLGTLDYASFMPPGSFINSQHLDIKKLGAIIDYLIKNPKTYEFFFDWKNHYFYTPRSRSHFCDLCTKLNSNNSITHRSYKHLRKWWDPDHRDNCRKLRYDHLYASGE